MALSKAFVIHTIIDALSPHVSFTVRFSALKLCTNAFARLLLMSCSSTFPSIELGRNPYARSQVYPLRVSLYVKKSGGVLSDVFHR